MTENIEIQNKGPFLGTRHVQTLLLFMCFVVNMVDRLKISVAVFAMTTLSNPSFEVFKWNKVQKGYIISGLYWGILLTQFLGSFMCRKFGAKLTILISTLGSAFSTILTPVLIPLGGWQMYTALSMVQGLFQGLFIPCVHEHIAKWAPIEERIRLGALSHTGVELGTILAMGVPGLIAQSSWGWPGISYVSGGMCFAWCVAWAIFADNSPTVSRFISPEEKHFILTSQQTRSENYENKKLPIPWRAICTSAPFISMVIIECAQSLGFKTMQNEIPSYLHGVMHMDMKSNALFSALPFLARFLVTNLWIVLGDFLLTKNIMSLTTLRKMVSTMSTWISALLLVLVGFLDERQNALAMVLMIATVGINGGKTIGSGLNAIDLSSNHAAILIGIVKTASSIVFMLTPLFVAAIVNNETDRSEWQIVFAITAFILFVCNLQYIFLGKTDSQPWNDEHFGRKRSLSTIEQKKGVEYVEEEAKYSTKKEPLEGYINHQFVQDKL